MATPRSPYRPAFVETVKAAGLRMGLSLVLPGRVSRRASLRAGAREAVFLVLGTVPMFILAGLIEGFVTPSFAPGAFKIMLGVLTGVATMCYLLFAGRAPVKAAESI
jgi:hypothetical protein